MKAYRRLLILGVLIFLLATPAQAQQELVLSLTRDFGYGGFSNDIEGLFSMHAASPENLQRVDFYIDAQVINTDGEAPFQFQFTTKDYAPGEHRLYALGFTSDGAELRSNELVRVFLSPEEGLNSVVDTIVPILAIIVVIALVSILLPIVLGRGKPVLGKYGVSGGAVCPKCGLPFPIHFLSLHAGFSHLERCPHCAKWVWVRKAGSADLAAAEARWSGEPAASSSTEEKETRARRQIDDSRYDN